MYQIRMPLPPLQPFIECFWFLRTRIKPPAQLEEIVFTDARADIVLTLGSPYLRQNLGEAEAQIMAVSNLDAQRRYPVRIVQQGDIDLIGVRFRPGGLAPFLPMPIIELGGLTLGLPEIFGRPGAELEERLFTAVDNRSLQLDLLNTFFMRHMKMGDRQALVNDMATTIRQQRGLITVRDLSQAYHYSGRTLNRLFKQVIGLSPKFYARTIRFRHALGQLLHDATIAWTDIVAACGYYDQPHFVKEFTEFTGATPETFRDRLQHDGFPNAPNHVQFLQDRAE